MSYWLVVKYLVTAAVVVFVSELARRSDRAGALLASLPLVTVLTLVWMYLEHQSVEKLANHARYTLWYVLPTLPMFVVFPMLLPRLGFWVALALSAALTVLFFGAFALALRHFGVELLP